MKKIKVEHVIEMLGIKTIEPLWYPQFSQDSVITKLQKENNKLEERVIALEKYLDIIFEKKQNENGLDEYYRKREKKDNQPKRFFNPFIKI